MASSPNPLLVIIILSWDSLEDTLTCLEAARKSDYPDFRILVVDNANQPELAVILPRDFPGTHLLQNQTNLGYAAGNNLGIQWALAQGAALILLLNDDICIEPETCRQLAAMAARIPNLAAVGGKIHPLGSPTLLWAAGESFPRHAPLVLDQGQFNLPRQVRYAVGGCILLTRAALQQVGLFDEALFMVHEEKDWCARAAQAGFMTWYTPAAVAWHDLNNSFTSGWSPFYHYLFVRNNLYLWQNQEGKVSFWLKIQKAIEMWWSEIVFIHRHGKQSLRRARAASRGVLDFLAASYGRPPAGL